MRGAALLLLALVVALVALPGCGEPPRGVVVWHPYRGAEQKALEKIAARFEGEHDVKVTLLAIPYEAYLSKLEAAIPRGNGPDVFLGPHNRLGEYLLHLLVAPAGDAFPDEDVATYEPATVAAMTHDGKRWAVPLASKCIAMYVNTELLAEPPRTLDELAAKKASLPKGVWPLVYESQSVYYHAALLHAFGGTLFENDQFTMVGPPAERSLDKARELTVSGVVPQEPSGDLVKQLFASGRAATAMSGPWLAGDLADAGAKVRYRVVPLPSIDGEAKMKPFLTVEGAFLTGEGARRAEVRAFARMLGGDAAARDRAEIGKQVVATRSFWTSPAANDPSMTVLRAFQEASQDAVPMPVSVAMNPAWDPALQALRKVIRGEGTAKAALDEAKARYDDVMRPPPPARSPAPLVVVLGAALLALAFFAVKRSRQPGFARELRASKPAYKYIVHSALTILLLVVLPLVAGAATSFFAGTRDNAQFVGFTNYVDILTVRGKPIGEWLSHGSFYLTLLVTVLWTVVNVVAHVGIGLVLGLLLARPFLRMRAIYRVLLILPWAVPSYVTALAWKGMFHRQFGAVNAILVWLGAEPVSWFAKFSTAFTANVATNVWLGFPFMMVVVMGALTSIPKDVLEAAEVDGATRWQAFRLVTLPLLRPTLLPAVVLGSVWTFNMFNVVFLVSGGEPDGTTDILVSEAYRWAFARNAQFGYAAAYAVIIFGLLALMSRVLGKIGKDTEAKA
jgi:arabinogalactan oligomer/maltooligosaccharide transport system permease protein